MIDLIKSLQSPVAQGMIWGIMAIGLYITFKILDLSDLTVDGSFATGGAVLVVLTTDGVNIYIATVIAFLAGCAAGFVTGLFHTRFGIPAILSGILTQLALYSVNLRIMSGRANVPISWRNYDLIVSSKTDILPYTIGVCVIIIAALIGILYWFFGTELGFSIRSTGCNPAMSRANGINTNSRKMIGFVLSNGIVALSGALLAQFQGNADVNMGRGAIVIGLASIIIGEVIFSKIFVNFALRLVAAVVGAIVYYLVIAAVLKIGLSANDLKMFSALIVALFLAVPNLKKASTGKHNNKKTALSAKKEG